MPKKITVTPELAMEWMRIIDECAGNVSEAARIIGVDRRTVKAKYDEYNKRYVESKLAARQHQEAIDFVRVKEVLSQNKAIRNKLLVTINPILDELLRRVTDKDIRENMDVKELVSIFKEVMPYIMEKASGESGEENGLPTKRDVVQKFIQNIYNLNTNQNTENKPENAEIITINDAKSDGKRTNSRQRFR